MAKAGIQPITTASLATPKISGISKSKIKSAPKPNTKAMSALFGKKAMKPTVQGVPTKVPSF
jgi:hypothetical protein